MFVVSIIDQYAEFLPITPKTPRISMGEGGTPLVRSQAIENDLDIGELYFKLEGSNPTGSFKDRGMVFAVAKALEEGTEAIMCASTGNTSAAAAAYGARYSIKTIVLVPKGNVAIGKLAQARMYGAKIVVIDGNFDECLSLVRQMTAEYPVTLVNSLNPYRIDGQKTAAFEIVDELGNAPDQLYIPVGNAGNITAYWKGFSEYRSAGKSGQLPQMMGFQAAGAAPIVEGSPIANPETIATAIRIGNPASWEGALAAKEESAGMIGTVTDEDIIQAYHRLAESEGIFGEPASAASLAGLIKVVGEGANLQDAKVVCVITGNGLKDPDTAIQSELELDELTPQDVSIELLLN
ncbi:MAG: threonine synthase [SAR202 cluster bacterium]|nr:threonine synthase [SAR202 cluster bacterium]